ncbi:hypothetical protein CHS0354_026545, partial [Potamilus streckersoni]
MKKLRNALLSSGMHSLKTRMIVMSDHAFYATSGLMMPNGMRIQTLAKFITNYLNLHPDSSKKMRNHLGEEVLNH